MPSMASQASLVPPVADTVSEISQIVTPLLHVEDVAAVAPYYEA